MRQHATLPGTTGAGKSTAILSLLSNALTQDSGFVLVDGKAGNVAGRFSHCWEDREVYSGPTKPC